MSLEVTKVSGQCRFPRYPFFEPITTSLRGWSAICPTMTRSVRDTTSSLTIAKYLVQIRRLTPTDFKSSFFLALSDAALQPGLFGPGVALATGSGKNSRWVVGFQASV